MKAVVYKTYGSPDGLRLRDIKKPTPKDDEVLIKVYAAAANPLDWHKLRASPFFVRFSEGLLKPKHPVLGADIAGRYDRATLTTFELTDRTGGTATPITRCEVQSATLRMYGRLNTTSNGDVTLAARGVEATWAEEDVTYATRPAEKTGDLSATPVSGTAERWYEWDVTQYVTDRLAAGDTLASISLQSVQQSTSIASFKASESSLNAPELVIVRQVDDCHPQPSVDLAVYGVADSIEESVGGFVVANHNHDEGNRTDGGSPAYDSDDDAAAGARIVPSDPDLKAATLSFAGGAGSWKLDYPDGEVLLWAERSPGQWSVVESGTAYAVAAGASPVQLKVEGLVTSTARRAVEAVATFTPAAGTAVQDRVRLTVAGVNLNVDSNNDDGYGRPRGDLAESALEGDAAQPGKLLYINDGDADRDGIPDYADGFNRDGVSGNKDDSAAGDRFVPMPLRLTQPLDLSVARFQITYSGSNPAQTYGQTPASGHLRVWKKDASQVRGMGSAAAGGDYVAPGVVYTAQQLGIDPQGRDATLWVEAVRTTATDASRRVEVSVDPDGAGPLGFIYTDAVYVTAEDPPFEPATIRGFKWNDLNENGLRDAQFVPGRPPEVLYILDVSTSTKGDFDGTIGDLDGDGANDDVTDVNNDGAKLTVLDGEIAGFIRLNNELKKKGFGDTARVGLVIFANGGKALDLDPARPGDQFFTTPNGAIEQVLRGITWGHDGVGSGTNYEQGLQAAIGAIRSLDGTSNRTTAVFLSDGRAKDPTTSPHHYRDEVSVLKSAPLSVNLRAFGVGSTSLLEHLQNLDPAATAVSNLDEVLDAFGHLQGGTNVYLEPPLAGWRVFVDQDGNGAYDLGEPQAVTGVDGVYSITGLPPGTYTVIEQVDQHPGWRQTAPAQSVHHVTVREGETTDVKHHFGNVFDPVIDLDIDSDNDDGFALPKRTAAEDAIEDDATRIGKLLVVNDDNDDGDGVADWVDGFNADGVPGNADDTAAGEQLVPLVVDLDGMQGFPGLTLSFTYSGSDPEALRTENGVRLPAEGHLRLWRVGADGLRTVADYVRPGQQYTPAELGFAGGSTLTLWVEAVAETTEAGQRVIRVDADADGGGPLNVSLSDAVFVTAQNLSDGPGSIAGVKFHDRNRNGRRDDPFFQGDSPDVVFIMDVSGSTGPVNYPASVFDGTSVGDLNGDGYPDLIIDAEIAGFIALNQRLVSKGLGATADVAVVPFAYAGAWQNMDPTNTSGDSSTWLVAAHPLDNRDADANRDVDQVLKRQGAGGGTYYASALTAAIDVFERLNTAAGDANVIFLSDGQPNDPGNYQRVAQELRNRWNANIRAFGLGSNSVLGPLSEIDSNARVVFTTDELLDAFNGLDGQTVVEEGLPGWTIYADYNDNGVMDPGEPSDVTDAEGRYEIDGLLPGTYSVREQAQSGWSQIAPLRDGQEPFKSGKHLVRVDEGQVTGGKDFGNAASEGPTGTLVNDGPVAEGSDVLVHFESAAGSGPLLFSFDVDGNGRYEAGGVDVINSPDRYTVVTFDDNGPHRVGGRISDAAGIVNESFFTIVDVTNVAPGVAINGTAPAAIDTAATFTAAVDDPSGADAAAGFDYAWYVILDGVPYALPTDAVTDAASFTFVPDQAGRYSVTVVVTDKDGGVGTSQPVVFSLGSVDTPDVSVAPGQSVVNEAGGISTFTLTRTAPLDDAVTVAIGWSGTAVYGDDYTSGAAATATFAAGSAVAVVTVTAVDDSIIEPDETIVLEVLPASGGGYTVGSPASATIVLKDDDQPTATSVVVSPAAPSLDAGGTQQFTAEVRDQFGNAMLNAPVAWSIAPEDFGSISSAGLYTAPSAASGAVTVVATSGAAYGTATVTVVAGGKPPAPRAMTAVALGDTRVLLAWTDRSSNEAGFRIERALDSGFTSGSTFLPDLPPNAVVHVDDTVAADTTYFYRVVALAADPNDGDSAATPAAQSRTLAAGSEPVSVTPALAGDPRADVFGGSAAGATGGDAAGLSYSGGAVRYHDGREFHSANDLAPAEVGLISGHTRTWSSDPLLRRAAARWDQGDGWLPSQWPTLLQLDDDSVAAVDGGRSVRFFDKVEDGYAGRYWVLDKLSELADGLKLTDTLGNVLEYFGFGAAVDPALQGKPKRTVDAGGNETRFLYDGANQLDRIERSRASDGAVLEQLKYQHSGGRLVQVEMRRLDDAAGSLALVREVGFSYSNAGLAGVAVSDANGVEIDRSLYRYDAAGRLTLVLEGGSYQRAVGGGLNPPTAAQAQLERYADLVFTYDAAGRLASQRMQGLGTYGYGYDFNAGGAAGFNDWAYRTVEVLPDGTPGDADNDRVVVYSNFAGQVLATVTEEGAAGTREWADVFRYDARGRLTLSAGPSAVQGSLNDAADDLVAPALRPNEGLVGFNSYYGDASAAAGYLAEAGVRRGTTGVKQPLSRYEYDAVRPMSHGRLVTASTSYRDAGGQGGITTRYVYTFKSGSDLVSQATTTLPPVAVGQNGAGTTAQMVERYDDFGRPVQFVDGENFLHTTAYDDATGAVTRDIVDAAAGGLGLTTLYGHDLLGRPTSVTDPLGRTTTTTYTNRAEFTEVRVVPPAVTAGGVSPPTVVTRDDRRLGVTDSLTLARADGRVESLARAFSNVQGQLVAEERYRDLIGVTYSPASGAATGSVAAKYRTEYGYDARGRTDRTVAGRDDYTGPSLVADPSDYLARMAGTAPTITRTVYDALDRVISEWVGTNDSGWLTTSATHPNLVKTAGFEYDGGVAGDSNLTASTAFVGGGEPDRVTRHYYDWRDRLVASKGGVQASETGDVNRPITYSKLDNFGRAVATYVFDGDDVQVGDADNDGVPDMPVAAKARSASLAQYDDRGQTYRSSVFSVDQVAGLDGAGSVYTGTAAQLGALTASQVASSGGLRSDSWFDDRGNVVKSAAPGGLVTKVIYDGAGRPTQQAVTDGGGDAAFADARSLFGDVVLEQSLTSYDDNGNAVFTVAKQRDYDALGTGDLDAGNARVSVVGQWYDEANRPVTTVNYGNNGDDAASLAARPSSPPPRDPLTGNGDAAAVNGGDRWLRTDQQYDAAGRPSISVSPRGIKTRSYYDALGRTIGTTEAYTGDPANDQMSLDPAPAQDADRATIYEYNGFNQRTWQSSITFNPSTPATPRDQATAYTYGVARGGAFALNHTGLLARVDYDIIPDSESNEPPPPVLTMTEDYEAVTGYNAQGEATGKLGRNGVTLALAYDVLGRSAGDQVVQTASYSDPFIDDWADGHRYGYDALGRGVVFSVVSGPAVVNQVRREFDGLGNLVAEYQEHDGAVSTADSARVAYTYATDFGGNFTRPNSVVYPSAIGGGSQPREVRYEYDYFGRAGSGDAELAALNERISRVGGLWDSGTKLGDFPLTKFNPGLVEAYDYLGLGTVVARTFKNVENSNGSKVDVNQSFLTDDMGGYVPDDAGANDPHDGLDRFGRPIYLGWNGTDTRFELGYDADGNKLFSKFAGSSIYTKWRSEIFHEQGEGAFDAYDRLGRSDAYYRGVMNSGNRSVSQENIQSTPGQNIDTQYLRVTGQTWGATAGTGGNFEQTGGEDEEPINRGKIFQKPRPDTAQQFDLGGTLDNDRRRDVFLTFDSWGQLTEQSAASFEYAGSGDNYTYTRPFDNEYRYDALGRRIVETETNRRQDVVEVGLFYDASGRIIQETRTPEFDPPEVTQYVFGAASDNLVFRDSVYPDGTGALPWRVWAMQDFDGSVVALREHRASPSTAVETILYNPTGLATYLRPQTISNNNPSPYRFADMSKFDWRVGWKGGRIARDQDWSVYSSSTTVVERQNGLLYLGGGEYDATNGRPLSQDRYAFFRPGGGASDVHGFKYSSRGGVNTQFPHNGTVPTWMLAANQMFNQEALSALGNAFAPHAAFIGSLASDVASVPGAAWGAIKETGYRVADFANDVMYLKSFAERSVLDSVGLGGLWSGPMEMYSGSMSSLGQMVDSGETSVWRATLSGVPGASNASAAFGQNLLTGEAVTGVDRAAAIFGLVGDAILLGKNLSHGAGSAYSAGGLRGYGRQVVENAARMATGRMPVCFVAGTRVLVGYDAEGNAVSRAIEDVAEGDLVLSRADGDEADGLDARAVARVFRRTSDHLQIVTYRDAAGGTETVRTTGEHPFWVEGAGWVAAGDLRAGDVLGDADGLGGARLAVLSSVREEHPEGVAVYNFEVEGDHTYLVEDGADGGPQLWVWVHNECQVPQGKWGKILYNHEADALGGNYPGRVFPGTDYATHAHHIAAKKGRSAVKLRVNYVHNALREVGIDPLFGRQNLVWAPNWGHPDQIMRDMARDVRDLRRLGVWNSNEATNLLQDYARRYTNGDWR